MKKGVKNPLLVSPAKTAACFEGNQLSKFDRMPFLKVDKHLRVAPLILFYLAL